MALFNASRRENRKERYKIVGIEMPRHQYSLITLYAMYKGIARSLIVGELITKWVEEHPVEMILRIFVDKLCREWDEKKALKPNANIGAYLIDMEAWLNSRRIDKDYINMITKMFLNAQENESKQPDEKENRESTLKREKGA